uniref:Uncharacterized protein n=1 Tax=Pristionchus pacificus TaxID=54126 RepID=A0A2A6CRM4_PRIPA|eukprot:PDM80855.1 hypothetical protein PRIPAC_35858 [Pristionchus pacificus]
MDESRDRRMILIHTKSKEATSSKTKPGASVQNSRDPSCKPSMRPSLSNDGPKFGKYSGEIQIIIKEDEWISTLVLNY